MATLDTPNANPIRLTIPPATPAGVVDPASLFAGNRLLKGIELAVLNEIAPRIDILDLKDGALVFEEGESGDALYLIASGSVKISKRGRGGQQETLTFLHENDYFGARWRWSTRRRARLRPCRGRPDKAWPHGSGR